MSVYDQLSESETKTKFKTKEVEICNKQIKKNVFHQGAFDLDPLKLSYPCVAPFFLVEPNLGDEFTLLSLETLW